MPISLITVMIMLGNDAYEWRSLLNIIPINNILVNCCYLSDVMENFRVPLLLYKAKFLNCTIPCITTQGTIERSVIWVNILVVVDNTVPIKCDPSDYFVA